MQHNSASNCTAYMLALESFFFNYIIHFFGKDQCSLAACVNGKKKFFFLL